LIETVRIPSRKLLLIRNGVDTRSYRIRRDPDLRHELGIQDGEFVVGAIGRLDPVKNHEGLIRAATLLGRERPGIRLVIVGDGPERAKVEKSIRTLGNKARPILTGYRSDVERFYGVFDVFVLNSFAEGMSNTLLEAMASALPVVCTRVGGNVELVEDQVRGTLVEAGDDCGLVQRLKTYFDSRDLMRRHGDEARRHVEENLSLSIMVQRYVELYRGVTQKATE
jgi:glycosyltransferase involved in cell wall biosynthesis